MSATASGGVPAYTYSWDSTPMGTAASVTYVFTDPPPITATVTVTDRAVRPGR